jgi:Leucine Rich repeat
MEMYYAYVIAAGAVIIAAGGIGLIIAAFRTHALWGFVTLFVIGAPFFILLRWPRARRPIAVILFGGIVAFAPYVVNYVQQHFIDLGERDKIVDGERHLTLTGWDKTDYSVLLARPDTVVLQMANSDVTDATLEYLKPMTKLRELDLNDTHITDAGLAEIKEKPLAVLRLRNTAITDAGFRDQLSSLETLTELDLRGTAVAPATFREWKSAKPGRKGFAPAPRPAAGDTP